jgi:hypothetical protein
MFDSRAFRSWPRIVGGGLGFGALFALVVLLADALFDGGFRFSRRVAAFGAGAFAGYVGIALLVRRHARRSD